MDLPDWPRHWQSYRNRAATERDWRDGTALLWTLQPGNASQYNPFRFKSDEQVREVELSCLDQGKILLQAPNKLTFFMRCADAEELAGACSGELTNFVFVEWHRSGAVHGRPISATALRAKGAKV